MCRYVIIIAAALPEELLYTYDYLSSCYEIDEIIQKRLSHIHISPYERKNTQFLMPTHTDSGFFFLQDATVSSLLQCSAFNIDRDCLCFLLVTGYGRQAVQHAMETMYHNFTPTHIYFVGCALGISEGIVKNTVVQVMETVQVDGMGGAGCSYDAFESRLSQFKMYRPIAPKDSKIDKPVLGVALCGDIFIDVMRRRYVTSSTPDNVYSMLPTVVHPYFKIVEEYSNGYSIAAVFDMESATFMQCTSSYLARQNTPHAYVLLMRVVLDTIFDTQKVNFRKDIVHISQMILKWICHHTKL